MPRFGHVDLGAIERTSTSPAGLAHGISEVLSYSVAARARVESCNPETGEYRIVLAGTLDLMETKLEQP